MTNFQLAIYKLLAGEYELESFATWVYSNKELEASLNAESYLAIISLDYLKPSSLYEAEKILRQYIDVGKYYEWYISRILQKIIERPTNVYKYIEQCYELYCNGFGFLYILSFDYALNIKVSPSNYSAESWHELMSSEQIELIDSFYPDIAEEAKKVLNWFSDRQIIIIDRDETNRSVNYLDRRSDKPT